MVSRSTLHTSVVSEENQKLYKNINTFLDSVAVNITTLHTLVVSEHNQTVTFHTWWWLQKVVTTDYSHYFSISRQILTAMSQSLTTEDWWLKVAEYECQHTDAIWRVSECIEAAAHIPWRLDVVTNTCVINRYNDSGWRVGRRDVRYWTALHRQNHLARLRSTHTDSRGHVESETRSTSVHQ